MSQAFVKAGKVVLTDFDMPIGSRLVIKRKAHAPQVLFLSVGRSLDNLVSRCFITAVLTLVGVLDVVDSLDLGWNALV